MAAEGIGGGMDWEFEISRCKLVYIEWINNNILLYSTGNYIQYPVINHNGKEYEKQIHAQQNHFAVQQKLTQHCKAAAAAAAAKSLQLCPTLCDPRDGSLPGSPVPGILQARTLEWVAISFSNA